MHQHCRSALLALAAALAWPRPAAAHDPAVLTGREVVHCMQARMKADKRESYREAFKICKQQADSRDGGSEAVALRNDAAEAPVKR